MAQGILVFIEEREGKIKKTSLEALSAARKLADNLQESVTALRVTAGEPSANLAQFGADKIIQAQHELLSAYSIRRLLRCGDSSCAENSAPLYIGLGGLHGAETFCRVSPRDSV